MKKILAAILLVIVALSIAAPALACSGTVHIVRRGETLSSISRWYGVNYWDVARANYIANPNHIYVGQRLIIPTCGYSYQPTYACGYTHPCYPCHGYRVRYGDTLSGVAWRHGVSLWALAQANSIYNMNYIYAGQCLTIPGGYWGW
jgi:LysM repeat protein